ncbi:MAG: YbhB/YbcL family Raf kinase inhibitor-like protein [Bdellovibrionales bacterium]|nr:YbhB/YbcL family Raf kinase inhibitor-like protein [Bdellovibrionales bacterium]
MNRFLFSLLFFHFVLLIHSRIVFADPNPTIPIISSRDFTNNSAIPQTFTKDGEDISPQLSWMGLPSGTKELALIVDDPDAPSPKPWVHWVVYKIPSSLSVLNSGYSVGNPPKGMLQGLNSWGTLGYRGPAPPKGHGIHHYQCKLYALDTPLDISSGLSSDELHKAMEKHILSVATLVGTYAR